jgi:hypothetical protein
MAMAIELSKRRARPRWSLKESFWVMVVMVVFDFTLVCVILERPLWQELEVASALVGVFACATLTPLLYAGVRLDNDRGWKYGSSKARWRAATDLARNGNGVDFPDFGGLGDDPISALIAIIFGIIALILIVIAAAGMLWLGLEVLYAALWLVFGALFWMYHFSLRWIVASHRRAEGRWGLALWGGLKGGLLASGGFFLAALLAWQLGGR